MSGTQLAETQNQFREYVGETGSGRQPLQRQQSVTISSRATPNREEMREQQAEEDGAEQEHDETEQYKHNLGHGERSREAGTAGEPEAQDS